MSKPIQNAVAVILRRNDKPDTFLIIKRPDCGDDLDGYWGLPASPSRPGELPEDTARRTCREKLGCDAVPLRMAGTMFQKRRRYDMFFIDIEMLLVGDKQPDVTAAQTTSTVYVDQQWTTNPQTLLPAAQNGSCCSTIFLTDLGLLQRSDWLESLENSAVVA